MSVDATEHRTAIVVGGGLAGLSAAYRLEQEGWKTKVLEASNGVGGRANTAQKNSYLIDTGAGVMVTAYHAYLELIDELGMSDQMVKTSPLLGIPRGGEIHEIDLDRYLSAGLSTKLLSSGAKFRIVKLAVDAFRAKARGYLDYTNLSKGAELDTESIRDYALRKVGQEANDYLCDPLARIMVVSDGDQVSKVELFSCIANVFGSEMLTLAGGVKAISTRLQQDLDVQLNSRVTQVKEHDDHIEVSWINNEGEHIQESASACVVATQLPTALEICPDYSHLLQPLSDKLTYTAAITVAIGTKTRPDTDAFILLLPTCDYPDLAYVFLDHNKSADRAHEGSYLINAHWVDRAAAANIDADDASIIEKTIEQLSRLFPDVRNDIEMIDVTRWPRALPLTSPGCYKAMADFNASLTKDARVQFAGDYMSAAGQNTAVLYGKKAAENLTTTAKGGQ